MKEKIIHKKHIWLAKGFYGHRNFLKMCGNIRKILHKNRKIEPKKPA